MSNYIRMYQNPAFSYERRIVTNLEIKLREEATYKRGVARWKSNNSVIPTDCAEFAAYLKLPIDLDVTERVRDRETKKFINEYRKREANHVYTAEERYEMDATFGPGQTIVNVITGKEYITK